MNETSKKGRPSVNVIFPEGEFTVKVVAEKNNICTASANLHIKKGIANKSVVLLRQEKSIRGLPHGVYVTQSYIESTKPSGVGL